MQKKPSLARDKLADPLRKAFLDFGYEQPTMVGLANACGLTRRALYHHFSDKEQAFRFVLSVDTHIALDAAAKTGREALARGDDAAEILTEVMDTRYGANRRKLAASPHAVEINDQAFRRARDIMFDAAIQFQDYLAALLAEMQDLGMIRLRAGVDAAQLAQMLADGARGSNQSLPATPPETLPGRYHNILSAILFGTVDKPVRKKQASLPMQE